MKKIYSVIPFLSLLFCSSVAARNIPLHDLTNPDSVSISGDLLVITDGESIHLYSLENFKLLKKFGKKGEGPGEFKFGSGGAVRLVLQLTPKQILVNSIGRVTFFTRKGEYLQEKKVSSGNHFMPIGNQYVGYSSFNENKTLFTTINMYDSSFGFVKELYRKLYYVQPNRKFNLIRLGCGNKRRAWYQVYKNKIYIEGENNTIHVFDCDGKKKSKIHLGYEKLKISEQQKRTIGEDLNKLYTSGLMRQLIREKGFFPDYFPARAFLISDDFIYIPTYQKNLGRTRFVILDLSGKGVKTRFVPFENKSFLNPYPFTINRGKLYQLVEDDETEEWAIAESTFN